MCSFCSTRGRPPCLIMCDGASRKDDTNKLSSYLSIVLHLKICSASASVCLLEFWAIFYGFVLLSNTHTNILLSNTHTHTLELPCYFSHLHPHLTPEPLPTSFSKPLPNTFHVWPGWAWGWCRVAVAACHFISTLVSVWGSGVKMKS